MAKESKNLKNSVEMSLKEARAYRASLYKPSPRILSEDEKREAFRIYWTTQKAKYGKGKSLEKAIWLHLKTIGMNSPEQFEQGLANFGLKKV
jgi:hypothetical protein